MTAPDLIHAIAGLAARRGLGLHEANALFNALYRSDVMMVAGGDPEKAAQIAQVDRCYFDRRTHQIAQRGAALKMLGE